MANTHKVGQVKRMKRADMYMADHKAGMTYAAIARKYGVTQQAVSKSCAKYRRRVNIVEVVRCKECFWAREKDHREPTDTPRELICNCAKHHYIPAPWGARLAVDPEHFCSYGERRTDHD